MLPACHVKHTSSCSYWLHSSRSKTTGQHVYACVLMSHNWLHTSKRINPKSKMKNLLACFSAGRAHDGLVTAGAGRTAHEAADTVKQAGQEASILVKKAGEALEDGLVAVVQAPRHLAETVKHQVFHLGTQLLCPCLGSVSDTTAPCFMQKSSSIRHHDCASSSFCCDIWHWSCHVACSEEYYVIACLSMMNA